MLLCLQREGVARDQNHVLKNRKGTAGFRVPLGVLPAEEGVAFELNRIVKNHRCTVGNTFHDVIPVRDQIAQFHRVRGGVFQFLDVLLQRLRPGLSIQKLLLTGLLLSQTVGDQNDLKPKQGQESSPEEDRPPGDSAERSKKTREGGGWTILRLPPARSRTGGKPDRRRRVGSAAAGGALLTFAMLTKTGFAHGLASSAGSRSGRFRSTISRITASTPRPEKASTE